MELKKKLLKSIEKVNLDSTSMYKRKIVITDLDAEMMELVKKTDPKILGTWAVDCAERVLPLFEKKYKDERPRKAIETLRTWVKTGIFKMSVIRWASLDSHAAARAVADDDVARSVARACGQAVATAHVKTHSIGAARYAATAIRDLTNSMDEVQKESGWQYNHLLQLIKGNLI